MQVFCCSSIQMDATGKEAISLTEVAGNKERANDGIEELISTFLEG